MAELNFDESKNSILEVLGWESDKSSDFMHKFLAYCDLMHDEGDLSWTAMLKNFLDSEHFKKLGLPLETNAHFMALGFVLKAALHYHHKECGCSKDEIRGIGIEIGGELKEKLPKKRDEAKADA